MNCPCCGGKTDRKVLVDLGTNTISYGEHSTKLTGRPAELAFLLAEHFGSTVRYTDLIYRIWGQGEEPAEALITLSVHAYALRKAVKAIGLHMHTTKGIGYALVGSHA